MRGFRRGRNIFADEQIPDAGEDFADLGVLSDVRIERILSSATPDTAQQVQGHDEWVVLVRGTATLELVTDGVASAVTLVAGDTLFIAAATPHRVLTTAHGSLWLALHAPPSPTP